MMPKPPYAPRLCHIGIAGIQSDGLVIILDRPVVVALVLAKEARLLNVMASLLVECLPDSIAAEQ
jgi:hypothetical protein